MEKQVKKEIEKCLVIQIKEMLEKCENDDQLIDSQLLPKVCSYLEVIISELFRQKYKEWKFESLDGIFPSKAFRIDKCRISISGMCILISDQCLIPLLVRLKISELHNQIDSIECKIGEKSENGIIKIPYSSNKWRKKLETLDVDQINWCYKVSYDKKEN